MLTNGLHKPVSWDLKSRRLYKHLTLAQGRLRLPGYNRYFIKFTSYNVLFFHYIHSVFPDVPAIFLHRRPAAILSSYLTGLPGWWRSPDIKAFAAGCTEEDLSRASDLTVAGRVLIHYYATALQGGDLGLQYLDYEDLTPAALPRILDIFKIQLSSQALDATKRAFRYDSRVDFRADLFDIESRRAKKSHVSGSTDVPPALQSLYERLRNSRSLKTP